MGRSRSAPKRRDGSPRHLSRGSHLPLVGIDHLTKGKGSTMKPSVTRHISEVVARARTQMYAGKRSQLKTNIEQDIAVMDTCASINKSSTNWHPF